MCKLLLRESQIIHKDGLEMYVLERDTFTFILFRISFVVLRKI